MASLVSYDSCGESDNEDESLSKMAKYEVIYVRFEVTLMIFCFQLSDVCYLCLLYGYNECPLESDVDGRHFHKPRLNKFQKNLASTIYFQVFARILWLELPSKSLVTFRKLKFFRVTPFRWRSITEVFPKYCNDFETDRTYNVTSGPGAPVASISRLRPSPLPVPPRPTRERRLTSKRCRSTRERLISKRCRRTGPRITNDSNSQNVNVRYFQLKALVSQVTDYRDYYVN